MLMREERGQLGARCVCKVCIAGQRHPMGSHASIGEAEEQRCKLRLMTELEVAGH